MKTLPIWLAVLILAVAVPVQSRAQDLPPPGASPRIDAIRKAGVLRVSVLANPPWLLENTSGDGPQWSGPAWVLAEIYAQRLGVKLETIRVSHETKVPVLASNQVDLSVTPLAENPERLKVIDFIDYTTNSVCMFGKASNARFTNAKTVDDLNNPDVTVAYLIGGAEEAWVKRRFPNAKLLGVAANGESVPIQEVMAGRADAGPVGRVVWPALNHKVHGLGILPKENDCQDSNEEASPGGMAIDKNQPVFLAWLRAVEEKVHPQVHEAEVKVIESLQ
jgi:polar amino acid transport system substrate-binding protein